jgi:hypothetical protein
VYRLLGSSSFALQAATGVFHAAAVVAALLVARRRRDGAALVAVGVMLLLLMQGYGLGALTEPWNPQLPMLWFVAFLVAAWAVVDGDLPMLLPAVLAASICAQTHVPYLAVTLGVASIVTVAAGVHAWRRRAAGGDRAGDWRWLLGSAALGLVLWAPPLIDEATNEPGNLSQIVDHLGSPVEEPIGIRAGADYVLLHLDAWQLVVGEAQHPGTFVRVLSGPGPSKERGLLTAAVWVACVAASAALRHRRLLGLHLLVGGSALVATIAISRIYGIAWPYLMLWAYGIGALMLLAIVATLVAVAHRWRPQLATPRTAVALGTTGLVVIAGLSLRLLAIAPDADTETPDQTEQLGRLVPDTVAALEAGVGAAEGRDGRYLVTWSDATNGGSEGIGLVNELIRRGFDVGVEASEGVKMGPHRVRPPDDATARIVLASGGWIERWEGEPDAVRIAYDDPATDAERAEFAQVRAEAIAQLRAQGREDLIDRVDTDLFSVALNEGVGGAASLAFGRLLDIGVPVAVFVLPAEAP